MAKYQVLTTEKVVTVRSYWIEADNPHDIDISQCTTENLINSFPDIVESETIKDISLYSSPN